MNEDLKVIKKKFGENMSKLCGELFPTLLETKGLLPSLLLEHFDANHELYDDIYNNNLVTDFKNYIYSLVDIKEGDLVKTNKTPKELFSEAGYDLYECLTKKDLESFKKYYKLGEELCTFKDDKRLDRCRVFFAIKKNVDDIKREDFDNPSREDKYGTSVLSIQFTKDGAHTLSIKNRYNHSVDNPDATFSNNLDNIIPGLTESFERVYGLVQKFKNKYNLDGYVMGNDGKNYKYNYEINNIYYCSNNVIIDNFEVKKFEKEKYIVLDYFILDLENKKIILYDENLSDSFSSTISDIKNIKVVNNGEEKDIIISTITEDIIISLDKTNKIIKYKNNNVKEINHNFLAFNNSLTDLDMQNVEEIGNNFLKNNNTLLTLIMKNVKKIGYYFMKNNESLEVLSLKSAVYLEDGFLQNNKKLNVVDIPNVLYIGDNSFKNVNFIKKIVLKSIENVGDNVFSHTKFIDDINLSNLKSKGKNSFSNYNTYQNLNDVNKNEKTKRSLIDLKESIKEYFGGVKKR